MEVSHGELEDYPGDYDTYRRLKAERERLRAKLAEEQRKLVERTEDFIRRNIAGQKTKQAQARRKMLAKLERVEAPREDANEVVFRFEEARVSGGRVLETDGLVAGWPETGPLLPLLALLLRRGDRLALWGPNGCGKTTLLRTMARDLPPLAGSAVPGTGVLVRYYDQEMRDLPPSWTVLDVVRDLAPTLLDGEARDFLALFDFRGDEVEQKVGTLSGGEKGRLSLARIVFGGANLLLLDDYKAASVKFNGDAPAELRGQLTLLGATKPVNLVVDRWKCAPHAVTKRTICGGNATGALKRTDFGMKWGVPATGDEVRILVTFEAIRD